MIGSTVNLIEGKIKLLKFKHQFPKKIPIRNTVEIEVGYRLGRISLKSLKIYSRL
jgi:hypothetical protein